MFKNPDFKFNIAQPDWNIQFPDYECILSKQNIEIYCIYTTNYELSYIEFVFENGRLGEDKKLSARVCANQILEGSLNQTQREIAETFDYYGCTYQILADMDFSQISLNVLDKFFDHTVHYLLDQVYSASFSEENLIKGKINLNSQLQHQITDPDFISYRELSKKIYGDLSVYGYNTDHELINSLQSADLREYLFKNYTNDKLKVFYCGKKRTANFWDRLLEKIPSGEKIKNQYSILETGTSIQKIPIENTHQVSLKIGKRIFKKSDDDYYDLYFINTLLGDYFGSRLMTRLREENGFCYDVNSTLDAQLHDGMFYISADLNAESKDLAIQLIKEELEMLATKKSTLREINMVKNYLNGHILRLIDGPYQAIFLLKILVTEFKNVDAFERLVKSIQEIHPSKICNLTSKYLNPEEMSIVLAGNTSQ
ncbi:MAG: insulinase family protein [Saprospiraceae bacterium]|nr:insulinase family protein [Saprospiraceae bacterium]